MYSKFIEKSYYFFQKSPILLVTLSLLQSIIAFYLFNLNIPNRQTGFSLSYFIWFLLLYFPLSLYISEVVAYHLEKKLNLSLGFYPKNLRSVLEKVLSLLSLLPIIGTIFVLINSIRFFGLFGYAGNDLKNNN